MMYYAVVMCLLPLAIIALLTLLGMTGYINATPICTCLLCCMIPLGILIVLLVCIELDEYKK